ncbi:MAG TPA: flagellar biosynthesis protein FlhA [Planctomycetota bacterium]|nr:flagellar biosynthesis protein FlhA [Planctomycetota bacterium]
MNETKDTPVHDFGTWLRRYADWILAVGVLGLVLTLVSPLPPAVLDVLLAVNITTSLLLLLVTMNAHAATELSVFPTLLLFATLFRLGLNVASTRLILSGGDAGTIIQAFGTYVAGQSLAVGLVVFLVLIIIQFVVITKGSGRISEVAARFVLDAMPGKQMAIDADLNSGLIDADEARERRIAVSKEAEFYGAMDGASKFVRGDAIAGLIITALNLVGGVAIASFQGMGLAEAGETYSKLTIGDGLVSQIPALFVSTAAAVLVTKASSTDSLGYNVLSQVVTRPRATVIAAAMLFAIGLLPGMPRLPFFLLASVLVVLWRVTRNMPQPEAAMPGSGRASAKEAAAGAPEEPTAEAREREGVEELLRVDRLSLEIGYRLIPLVQDKGGTGILEHIAQLRRRFATREGLLLPPVRIKDNIRLVPNGYRILVGGQEVGRGEVEVGHLLAMDGGGATAKLRGKSAVDPAFGLPAVWIAESLRDEAEVQGYTVIDPVSVLVTHISEIIRQTIGEILSRDDVKALVENAKKVAPAVVGELIPERIGYGEVQAVLRNLLREGVSIRNMPAILETIADHVARTKDPEALTELVRQRLGRALCEMHADKSGTLWAVTLDPTIEARLASAVGGKADPEASPVSPAWLSQLVEQIGGAIGGAARGGKDVVLLARSGVRRFLGELVRASLPKVAVLSYQEVVPARAIETLTTVRMEKS